MDRDTAGNILGFLDQPVQASAAENNFDPQYLEELPLNKNAQNLWGAGCTGLMKWMGVGLLGVSEPMAATELRTLTKRVGYWDSLFVGLYGSRTFCLTKNDCLHRDP